MKSCCVLGLGYIGLPTAALLASKGYKVTGVDINEEVVNKVNNGEIHISEPKLMELVKKSVNKNSLKASTSPEEADVFIIAVPTPFKTDNISNFPLPNLEFVFDATKAIAKVLRPGNLVIIESTSPVGTTKKVYELLKEKTTIKPKDINIAYCPERVIPGRILEELINNDRVVGGDNELSTKLAVEFYKDFCKGNIFITNSSTAELVKLTENSYRDLNIAFANELSIICDRLSVNHKELISLANKHPRVNILDPGCGVGGHCIAVDPWFLISELPEETRLIKKSRETNLNKTQWVIEKIEQECESLENKLKRSIEIGCFGLAFKPNIDDLRESPALEIVSNLIKNKKRVLVCEPNLENYTFPLHSSKKLVQEMDLLIFLVAHDEFKLLNLKNKNVLDFCGVFNS